MTLDGRAWTRCGVDYRDFSSPCRRASHYHSNPRRRRRHRADDADINDDDYKSSTLYEDCTETPSPNSSRIKIGR